ncbi:clostripain [Clostridium botulinum]|uniref:Clostripain n=1 Tax=Clostridium botulinum D str. 1873 TaxID=592027 RepID=A0A9P2G6H2_CLOBO|nr:MULTISPECIES: clostripain [Clostridium]EES90858.1 clostripain [Clostridium botulinum D str. 1873]MBO3440960.1 clostripain [Clostridium haemolyticum]NFV47778.1 clostripain [Clostridium botulinum]
MLKKIPEILTVAILGISFIGANPVYAVSKNTKSNKPYVNESVKKQDSNGQKVTILYYCDADNNLEGALMSDIAEMKRGYVNNPNLNLIALVDRTPNESNDSTALGENFEDTRLYKIEHNKAIRLDGGKEFPEIKTNGSYEANMGDAQTLKKFIEFGKAHYKADKYILLMSNHGGGAKDNKNNNPNLNLNKAICWDDSSSDGDQPDCLYMGEISDNLTDKHSVDVLAFDACLMGTAEVAYQFRPDNGGFSAKTMIASSPVVWGPGFKYDNIFSRIREGNTISNEDDLTLGGKEKSFDPETITNEQIGALFVEEQRDSVKAAGRNDQQLSCYDLNKVKNLKESFDKLAVNLSKEDKKIEIENLRGTRTKVNLIHYFNERKQFEWIEYPYFDIYDLCQQISLSNKFSKETKTLASNVMKDIDSVILYSFGGSKFNGTNGFKEGKNGLSVFLPDGNRNYIGRYSFKKIPHWQIQSWYNSIDTVASGLNNPYGKLSWCKDGQNPKKNTVGNWFELLDSWFDTSNGVDGGLNHYQW